MSDQRSDISLDFLMDQEVEEPEVEETDKLAPRIGRDEMNLAEFPFALLSDRAPEGLNTITFEDTVEGKDGKLVRRTWTVTGGDKFGLPVAGDEQVYVVLMEVAKEQGFDQRTIPITRYDLIKRLGWANKGDSYRRLREALDRLLGVTITAKKAFWDKAKQRYVDVGFHIIDDYALYDETPGRKRHDEQEELPLSFISWSQVIFRSFQAGNIKQLDTAFYFGLRSSLSRRLYRYLDKKRFDGKPTFRIGLKKLAFEKLGMSRNYYPSHIKQELQRAHFELITQGFMRDFEYVVSAVGEEQVIYYFHPRKFLSGKTEAEGGETQEAIVEELVQQGITPGVARALVRDHEEEVRLQLQYLPYRAAQDAAAVLVEAIRGQWEPPASFLKARIDEERRQREEHRRDLRARMQAEVHARKALERAAAEAVFKALDDEEQAKVMEEARKLVAEENPSLARRPTSKAFEALCQEELTGILRREYAGELDRVRETLRQKAGTQTK